MELIAHEELPQRWLDRNFLTSRRWLGLMGDRPPGRRYYFELVGDHGTIAATTGYLIDDSDCYESFNIYDLMWREPPVFLDQPPRPTRPGARDAWFPSLALVQPGYECSIVGASELSVERVTQLLAAVVRGAVGAGAASVAVLYAAGTELVTALSVSPRWHRITGTVRSSIDVPSGGMDAYFGALARSQRKQVRADLRDLAQAAVQTEALPGVAAGEAEVRLRMNLIKKYGEYSTVDVERQRLDRLRSVFPGDRLQLFRSRINDGKTLGFSLFIRYADQWHSFWCGFDYGCPQSRWMYFDVMFYAPVRSAAESRIALIDYGIGYEQSKLLRGCRADSRDVWVASLGGELDHQIEFAAARDRRLVTADD